MPRDKEGNILTWKEYRARWKGGIQKITALQQTKVSLMGQLITLAGIVFGLVVSILARAWWLSVILLGALIVSLVQLLGTYQKYFSLKELMTLINKEEGRTNE